MTMVIESQGRHYGGMGYDSVYSHHMQNSPQFADSWPHTQNASSTTFSLPKQDSRPSGLALPYSNMQTSSPSATGSSYSTLGFGASDLLSLAQDIPRSTYPSNNAYTTAATSSSSYATAGTYPSLSYQQQLHQQQAQQQQRKLSDSNDHSRANNPSFGELDASRGMLALSHQSLTDLTPRNIYDVRVQRGSGESYGFPPTHSSTSSISTTSERGFPYYGASSITSVDSGTDYSSAASDTGYDSMTTSRTLPRPSQLVGANLGPPAPQSMMGQFSSKMSSNTQKKHKCKICDKRFTRPSSLQTHVYSHTGEKPFACDVEGCGRHFSVVSNLRRHKKVHKGESVSSHSDCED